MKKGKKVLITTGLALIVAGLIFGSKAYKKAKKQKNIKSEDKLTTSATA